MLWCFQAELEQAISYLETKIPSLRDEIEKRQTDEVLPPEDAIETTAPLYRQLLQCHAEEQAIEDTLYILGDSLRHEVITIELYLKVRRHYLYCLYDIICLIIKKCRGRCFKYCMKGRAAFFIHLICLLSLSAKIVMKCLDFPINREQQNVTSLTGMTNTLSSLEMSMGLVLCYLSRLFLLLHSCLYFYL